MFCLFHRQKNKLYITTNDMNTNKTVSFIYISQTQEYTMTVLYGKAIHVFIKWNDNSNVR